MSVLTVRGCRVGKGRPKIIIPIVEQSEADIAARAAEYAALPAECVEWRADWLGTFKDISSVKRCLGALRAALGEKLLLVTCRTEAEGGEVALSREEYAELCRAVIKSGCADLIDLELVTMGEGLAALIAEAHEAGVAAVVSSHDFNKTPPAEELKSRISAMRAAGTDIAKIAVMPQSDGDVGTLLAVSAECGAAAPLIAISMGARGAVSRVIGEAAHSCMTFACAGKASAPGQIELGEMNKALSALHKENIELNGGIKNVGDIRCWVRRVCGADLDIG